MSILIYVFLLARAMYKNVYTCNLRLIHVHNFVVFSRFSDFPVYFVLDLSLIVNLLFIK